WDIIDSGVNKRHNRYDDEQSEQRIQLDHCSKKCWGCGVCFKFDMGHDLAGTALDKIDCSAPPKAPAWEVSANHPPHDKAQRLRCRFVKDGDLRFISHLDLARLFERALRRAGLPVVFSQGFNPHPAIEFAAPLALGVTSEAELVDIYLADVFDPAEFQRRLNDALPPEGRLHGCWPATLKGPSLMSLVDEATYRVTLADAIETDRWVAFLALGEIPFAKQGKTGTRIVDLRPLIRAATPEDDRTVILKLQAGSRGNAKPEDVMEAMSEFLKQDLLIESIRRLDLVIMESAVTADVEYDTATAFEAEVRQLEDQFGHLLVH
ncbi:MAG: TIGR03936 family radical SAM-associated protein, partial [Cyanobacteria bacterium REEB65]|nr:TIGR03936 family radical SAM-associated protein [Cyanobacteria bacterium REEB65]